MTAMIIDGKAVAETVRNEAASRAAALAAATGVQPGLAVVLVGDDPASDVYVRNKARQTVAVGMASFEHRLSGDSPEAEVLALVERLNTDPAVHGILVQMPLPSHIDADRVVLAIDPAKDVDGLTPANAGRLVLGRGGLVPCTPQGCILLIKTVLGSDLAGREALVIGRSILVGKPVALLLQAESCTVTMAHSRTRDLADHCRRSDIVIAAVGRPELVRGDWIKPGAVVIDVGINRVPGEGGKTRLIGDVAFDEVKQVAGAVTPVPGGVGPMTIACLLNNTVTAAEAILGR